MNTQPRLRVGDVYDGPLGSRTVRWRVTWVGVRKARLKAELDYGWCTTTVWIDRFLDSPDWELVPRVEWDEAA